MPATLNQDDIKLLKSVFATKDDLVAMEQRQDAKYATKGNLTSMEKGIRGDMAAMEKGIRGDMAAMEKRQDAKYSTKSDLTSVDNRIRKDMAAMEKRQDAKYATKTDLQQFATRVEIKQMIEDSENEIINAVTSVEIDLRSRIGRLEDEVGISPSN